ncbi:RNA-binding protein [Acetitomaculum ruminis DSM 5522]|uniref:RNA-binding protein n=1 Tax=Acetitomaculum ruminis DSM 5522 TaxID=1120918 RepID=A0A1I0V6Z8_9FIRM|nr:YhbY family RNA-binding protein [Acetitomaculum ruminis]SFA71827.1 RNA-binding protein [Acetitomaculum ruminis DSM 5522]
MTSKQRAYLNKLAANEKAVLSVGKEGVTPEFINALDEVLEKRELVKITFQKNSPYQSKDMAQTIAERTNSEIVSSLGRKLVFFRVSKTNNKIII